MLSVADTWDLSHFAANESWQGSDRRRRELVLQPQCGKFVNNSS